jgi:predicted enzyme related to lactoylglutathione lyase
MGEPVGWLRALVCDAQDSERLSQFWQEVVGVPVAKVQTDWIRLAPDKGGVCFAFEPLPADAAPVSPRLRPDIEVEDLDVAQTRVEELGGRLVAILYGEGGESHRRMADPEGNEFTLVLPEPED